MEIIILESKHAGSLVKSVLDLKIENFNEKIKKQKISKYCFNWLYWEDQIRNEGFQKQKRSTRLSSRLRSCDSVKKQVMQWKISLTEHIV